MRTVKVDRWEPDDQEYAVAFLVLSSVGGSVVGAVVGGLWRIATLGHGSFGFSLLRVVLVTRTRSTLILDKEPKRRHKGRPRRSQYLEST